LSGARDTGLAERHQQLAVLVELHDGVALAVVLGAAIADQTLSSRSM
jgi:hypothetical protein